jgi:SPP1 family predicted phage head-tail adaptor
VKPIEAGKYKRRVTIERNTPTRDGRNQPIPHWAAVKTLSAEIVPQSSREFIAAKAQHATITHLIKFRYQGPSFAVTPVDRLDYQGRKLNVLGAWDAEEAHREYVVACQEEV